MDAVAVVLHLAVRCLNLGDADALRIDHVDADAGAIAGDGYEAIFDGEGCDTASMLPQFCDASTRGSFTTTCRNR